MATQRYISTSFWDDRWIRSLDPSEKFIYLYLMTNPLTNIAGVYEITVDRICFDTGYNSDTVERVLDRFSESGKAFFLFKEWIAIPTWPKHQKTTSPKIQQGIEKILGELPQKVLKSLLEIDYRYPIKPYLYSSNYLNSDININSDTDTIPDPPETSPPVDNSEPEEPAQPAAEAEIRKQLQKIPFASFTRTQITIVSGNLGGHNLPPHFLAWLAEDIRGKPKIENPGGFFWTILTNLSEHEDLIDRFRKWKPKVEQPNICPTCNKKFANITISRASCRFCGYFDWDGKAWVSNDHDEEF